MADQVMKASAELAVAVPEMWSPAFYDVLLAMLPFNDSVSREYEGEIRSLGDTVNISSFPEFGDAVEMSEDDAVDAQAVTMTGQQLVINKQVALDYIYTDKARIQALPFDSKARDMAFYAVMKKMQDIIIAATVPSAAAPDHQIAYDSGTTLALADILEAKELLDTQNVPDDGQRVAILGAAQSNDLFNITGFTSRDFIPAGSPLTSGAITTPILGFRARMTTEVGNTSYWFHSSYLSLAVQQAPEIKVFDLGSEGKRAVRVNTTVLFGVKQLDNKRVVSLS